MNIWLQESQVFHDVGWRACYQKKTKSMMGFKAFHSDPSSAHLHLSTTASTGSLSQELVKAKSALSSGITILRAKLKRTQGGLELIQFAPYVNEYLATGVPSIS
jgi:hypothetical protein